MMAMFRYIDDLCLDTRATLLYCVRTNRDIMFESELEQLRTRLENFQYHVTLSQPRSDWTGPRGHISREFVESTVNNLASAGIFYLWPCSVHGCLPRHTDWLRSEARTNHAGELWRAVLAQKYADRGAGRGKRGGPVCPPRQKVYHAKRPDFAGSGRGKWSRHALLLPAGAMWGLQDRGFQPAILPAIFLTVWFSLLQQCSLRVGVLAPSAVHCLVELRITTRRPIFLTRS
jgi:Oxidoreductase NAD-binding domain